MRCRLWFKFKPLELDRMNMPLSRQSGATLLILMLVMMSVLATLLVSSLRGRNAEDTRREQSAAAIEQARQALLAWSLSRDGTSSGRGLSPTELPCPADPNAIGSLVGVSRSSCTTPANLIGLLPWKTLGIAKITDSYGEPLWYSLDVQFSVRFQSNTVRRVNSDNLSLLEVFAADGTTNYSLNGETAAAVIFAPGPALTGQDRTGTLAVAQYLEGVNGKNNATLGGPFIAGELSANFNDQLGIITGRELIDRSARRLGDVIGQQLNVYYQAFATNYPSLVLAPRSPFARQNMLALLQQILGATSVNVYAASTDFGDVSICRRRWNASIAYDTGMMVMESPGNSSNWKNYTALAWSQGVNPTQGNPPQWGNGTGCALNCAPAWTSSGRNSGGTAYFKNDMVSRSGKNWQAIQQIGIGLAAPPSGDWADAGSCIGTVPTPTPTVTPTPSATPTPSVTPIVTPTPTVTPTPSPTPTAAPVPYPYPADMVGDSSCRDNNIASSCASKPNLCTGILPRAADSWTGVGVFPTPVPGLPVWFQQNIWHRGILYAVKQGSVCTANFSIDGAEDVTIDALFILPGAVIRPTPNPIARANNTVVAANASTDLSLYLEDAANQNKWTNPNDRNYVTPSCSSNDVMYTCNKGVCSKRKRAC
ncbi:MULTISPECIES: type II secretion system protein [Deefgea]|uniref:type II secretion system protein n=1 Tax=Deefgea TaxID=400947 RepID=UPI001941058D|nr:MULTISPECIES: hypothetical protein [Deefgea]MBM9890002.1 hypothetical protein [Deefgea sp. CFH1-16]